MLKAKEDEAGSAYSQGYDDDDAALPLRDVEKPKRIIEVVYGKVLELEKTIKEHLADLMAAGDVAQASMRVPLLLFMPLPLNVWRSHVCRNLVCSLVA
jgi:hypothetical protein